MKPLEFVSSLADRFSDFLTFRRIGGVDSRNQFLLLRLFDRFLDQESFQGRYPTREVVERYLASVQHTSIPAAEKIGSPSCVRSVATCVSSNRSALFPTKGSSGKGDHLWSRTSIRRWR